MMDVLISKQKVLERLEWKRPEIGADGSRDRHRYMQWMADMDAVECTPPAQPELIEKVAYIRGFEQGRTQGMIDAQGGKK